MFVEGCMCNAFQKIRTKVCVFQCVVMSLSTQKIREYVCLLLSDTVYTFASGREVRVLQSVPFVCIYVHSHYSKITDQIYLKFLHKIGCLCGSFFIEDGLGREIPSLVNASKLDLFILS